MHSLTNRDFCAAVILSFGHFLWLGTLIAGLAAAVVGRLPSATARYRGFVITLGLMAMTPFLIYVTFASPPEKPLAAEVIYAFQSNDVSQSNAMSVTEFSMETVPADGAIGSQPLIDGAQTALPVHPSALLQPQAIQHTEWRQFAPGLVDVYLFVVVAMVLRLFAGLWGGRWLRLHSTPVLDHTLLAAMRRQARLVGLKCAPALAFCEQVAVPTVIGILKPTILLPLTFTSGLSVEQIESILAHELAHLRRYDHLINLLQRLIESLLFFHPAVWRLSQRIRIERENCCDDMVIAGGSTPLDYVKTLLQVAELGRASRLSASVSVVSLLATGQPSTLRKRIARLLDCPLESPLRLRHPWAVGGLVVALAAAAWTIGAIDRFWAAKTNDLSARERNDQLVSDNNANKPAALPQDALANNEQDAQAPSNVEATSPQPAVDELSRPKVKDELDELIDRAIEVTYKRHLVAGSHTPWQIMHGIRAFGLDWPLRLVAGGDPKIRAAEWIASAPRFDNEPVWQFTQFGARAHPFSKAYFFEGLPGQFLASLADANVTVEFPFKAVDEDGITHAVTVRDLVNYLKLRGAGRAPLGSVATDVFEDDHKLRASTRGDLSWVLRALVQYEPIDAEWTDAFNEKWSIERLVKLESESPIVGARLNGHFRLYALATALDRYRNSLPSSTSPLHGPWQAVEAKLNKYIEGSKSSQFKDGSFPCSLNDWDGPIKDLNSRFGAMGWRLAWLAVAVPDDQIREEWVSRATRCLANDLIEHQTRQIDVGPLFDSAFALRLIRDRRNRIPAAVQKPSQPASDTAKQNNLVALAQLQRATDRLLNEKGISAEEHQRLVKELDQLTTRVKQLLAEGALDRPKPLATRVVATGELPPGAVQQFGTDQFVVTGWNKSVDYTPDGQTILVKADQRLALLDRESGRRVSDIRLNPGPGMVWKVVSSPDRERIAVVMTGHIYDGEARNSRIVVMNASTGKRQVLPWDERQDDVRVLNFSWDNKTLVAGTDQLGLRFWNLETGELISKTNFADLQFRSAAFSPDGQTLVMLGWKKHLYWKWQTDEEPRELPRSGNQEPAFAKFSPDGKWFVIAASGVDGARFFNAAGDFAWQIDSRGKGSFPDGGIAFTGDSRRVAIPITGANTVEVWDMVERRRLDSYECDEPRAVAISRDDQWMVAAGSNSFVYQWNLGTGQASSVGQDTHKEIVTELCISADGQTLVSGSYDGTARVWDIPTGKQIHLLEHKPGSFVRGVSISQDDRLIATSAVGDTIGIWDRKTGDRLKTFVGSGRMGACRSVQFSSDSRQLVAWSDDDWRLRWWEVESGAQLPTRPINLPEMPNKKTLPMGGTGLISRHAKKFFAGFGGNLFEFDATTGKQVRQIPSENPVEKFTLSPDGRFLATTHSALTQGPANSRKKGSLVRIRNIESLNQNGEAESTDASSKIARVTNRLNDLLSRMEETVSTDYINHLVFSADSQYLAYCNGSSRQTIDVVDAQTGRVVSRIPPASGCLKLEFTPDGKRIAVADYGTKISLWDIAHFAVKPN